MTKTQIRRAYNDILGKAEKLRQAYSPRHGSRGLYMSTKDLIAIEAIISKYQKKL